MSKRKNTEVENHNGAPKKKAKFTCGAAMKVCFNEEFEFVVDERMLSKTSKTFQTIIEGDSAAHNITFNIPSTNEAVYEFISNHLKTSKFCDKITNKIWSDLWACSEKLDMQILQERLRKYFTMFCQLRALPISKLENFHPSFIPLPALKTLIPFDDSNRYFAKATIIFPKCKHGNDYNKCGFGEPCSVHYNHLGSKLQPDICSHASCFRGTGCTKYVRCKEVKCSEASSKVSDWFQVFKNWLDRYNEPNSDQAWIMNTFVQGIQKSSGETFFE